MAQDEREVEAGPERETGDEGGGALEDSYRDSDVCF